MMYSVIKKSVRILFPKSFFFKAEPFLRKIYSYNKKGNNHECIICDFKTKKWIKLPNKDSLCPSCGSLSRDRRLWQLISKNYLKTTNTILDFSPSRTLYRKWKKENNIRYTSSDLSGDFISDVKFDITNLNEIENKYDLIICYHIFEHVIEDLKAMKEVYRVLNSEGTLLIQTPFKEGEIYEDYTITSEKERLTHFGQEDHVRIYSILGLKERLQKVGFNIEILQFKEDKYFGFSANETILIAKK